MSTDFVVQLGPKPAQLAPGRDRGVHARGPLIRVITDPHAEHQVGGRQPEARAIGGLRGGLTVQQRGQQRLARPVLLAQGGPHLLRVPGGHGRCDLAQVPHHEAVCGEDRAHVLGSGRRHHRLEALLGADEVGVDDRLQGDALLGPPGRRVPQLRQLAAVGLPAAPQDPEEHADAVFGDLGDVPTQFLRRKAGVHRHLVDQPRHQPGRQVRCAHGEPLVQRLAVDGDLLPALVHRELSPSPAAAPDGAR
ncbi:hypothetical protein [Streptomyces chumphonensis]|uniref:hypothetical protein n=1 Tax=Streptomyces chumphonensis TaxID=1214925 RepID=UPI003D72B38A